MSAVVAWAVPEDHSLEGQVLGAVLAYWLRASLDVSLFWYPRHQRIVHALADADAVSFGYAIEDCRLVVVLEGLDLDAATHGYARFLAERAPACTDADVVRLADLALRRQIIDACASSHERAASDFTVTADEIASDLAGRFA